MPKTTSNFNQGVLWDFKVSVSIALSGVIITTSFSGVTGQSNPFDVLPGNLDHFRIATITSPQIAGKGFLITITAEDSQNNITNYSGVAFLSDASNTILPTITTNFSAGRWQGFVSMTKSGSTTILAQSKGKYGASNEFKVIAAELAKIDISPNPAVLRVDELQRFSASGYDAYGNGKEVEIGNWKLEMGIGTLTNIIGKETTFIGGTKATTGTLVCTSGTITSKASITINPGDLAKIIIDPAEVRIEVDGTGTFTAFGYDKYGNERKLEIGNWKLK